MRSDETQAAFNSSFIIPRSSFLTRRRLAAEEREHLARDVARIRLRGEVDVGGRDLFGLRGSPQRRVLAELRDLLGGLVRRVERGPHGAGRDAVDAYAPLDEALRERLREGVDRALRGRVVQKLFAPLQARYRARVDYGRALLHPFERGLRHEEVAVDVRLEGAVELLLGHVFERLLVLLEGRVVDEYVELAELLHRPLDGLAAEPRLAHVAGDEQRPTPLALYRLARLLRVPLLFGKVDDCHVRALAREEDCDGAADAGVAARDERGLVVEFAGAAVERRFVFGARRDLRLDP